MMCERRHGVRTRPIKWLVKIEQCGHAASGTAEDDEFVPKAGDPVFCSTEVGGCGQWGHVEDTVTAE